MTGIEAVVTSDKAYEEALCVFMRLLYCLKHDAFLIIRVLSFPALICVYFRFRQTACQPNTQTVS